MPKAKVAITLDEATLERLDRLVRSEVFRNRSQAVQEAVEEKIAHLERSALARELKKVDPAQERAIAEEGLSEDVAAWPEY